MHTLLLGAAILGAPAPALAGQARLVVDNTFDGLAEVWVGGAYAGLVRGEKRTGFDVAQGLQPVVVRRPNGGPVLLSTRVHLSPAWVAAVRVLPPPGTLRVANAGPLPLRVEVEDTPPVWMAPGTAVQLTVASGRVSVHSAVREGPGVRVIDERVVWVGPGRSASTTVGQPLEPVPAAYAYTSEARAVWYDPSLATYGPVFVAWR